jgi:hypothetical protein
MRAHRAHRAPHELMCLRVPHGALFAVTSPLYAGGLALVGDVGGTNTRLQLYELEAGDVQLARGRAPGKLVSEKQYLNGACRTHACEIADEHTFMSGERAR